MYSFFTVFPYCIKLTFPLSFLFTKIPGTESDTVPADESQPSQEQLSSQDGESHEQEDEDEDDDFGTPDEDADKQEEKSTS